jgi:hypothetical protein
MVILDRCLALYGRGGIGSGMGFSLTVILDRIGW